MKYLNIKAIFASVLALTSAFTNADSPSEDLVIKQAIEHSSRLKSDIARDVDRKPAEILNFFGVKPGAVVMDMMAGRGYYSELSSYIVGDEGKVIIHNIPNGDYFYGEGLDQRLNDLDALSNTVRMEVVPNDISLNENSIDTVLLILSYHDFYFHVEGYEKTDVKKVLENIRTALKPGGVIGIIDHVAKPGAPRDVGGTLHRIDPEIIKEEMQEAGFELTGELAILKNSSDDLTKAFWDMPGESTSRSVLRFKNNK